MALHAELWSLISGEAPPWKGGVLPTQALGGIELNENPLSPEAPGPSHPIHHESTALTAYEAGDLDMVEVPPAELARTRDDDLHNFMAVLHTTPLP